MSNTPSGFAVVAGRGAENARVALHATELAGRDPNEVRTSREGYIIHESVEEFIDQAREALKEDAEDTGEDAADADTDTQDSGSDVDDAAEQPKGNASLSAWEDWAEKAHGYDRAEGLTRDEIKTKYTKE